MNFTENSYNSTPEILKRKLGGEYTAPITLHATAFTSNVCKAGNPIDADGKKVNGGGSDGTPVGILLNDVTSDNPNGTIVKGFAVINTANANTNAGITIASSVKTALSHLVFE